VATGQHQRETALREENALLRDFIANNMDPNIVSPLFGLLIIKESQRAYAGINVWLRSGLNWIETVFNSLPC
jgi:hypothetical protein